MPPHVRGGTDDGEMFHRRSTYLSALRSDAALRDEIAEQPQRALGDAEDRWHRLRGTLDVVLAPPSPGSVWPSRSVRVAAGNKAAGFVSYGLQGGVRAVEYPCLVMAELQIADVRAQVALSLFDDVTDQQVRPADHQTQTLHRMLDQLTIWADALKTVRTAWADALTTTAVRTT